ncbi:cytochrome c [Paracoccus sp. (in: a-proteobacteria)]|uniref:c-type cytochrome n=1 Tax=Paracoccus sp. TaxID=267 RepID=UPI0026DF1C15|nr:cytochrome c [Paracoccus sp. (in: a-proteobacteria)]MDO5648467.1 cytochrome c [Paracoccus sp. (in: a-proteobacteria)]
MRIATFAAIAALIATPLMAQTPDDAMQARQGYMKLVAAEMGKLSGMARGEIAFDQALADAAAANLAALGSYDVAQFFVEGTSSNDLADSDALPAIWGDFADFQAKLAAFSDAAKGAPQAVADAGGNLGPALQGLGTTCRDCHQPYRRDR